MLQSAMGCGNSKTHPESGLTPAELEAKAKQELERAVIALDAAFGGGVATATPSQAQLRAFAAPRVSAFLIHKLFNTLESKEKKRRWRSLRTQHFAPATRQPGAPPPSLTRRHPPAAPPHRRRARRGL